MYIIQINKYTHGTKNKRVHIKKIYGKVRCYNNAVKLCILVFKSKSCRMNESLK